MKNGDGYAGGTQSSTGTSGLNINSSGINLNFQRTNRLARHLPPAQAAALMEAARRLGEPNRMGRLFKALAMCSAGRGALPGF